MATIRSKAYREALQRPTTNRIGWSHADADSMNAACAEQLGIHCCLSPDAIYEWAKRHGITLQPVRRELLDTDDLLLICVLNDWSLEMGRKKLRVVDEKGR